MIHFTKDHQFTSLHFTSLHFTSLHFTPHFSRPYTSEHFDHHPSNSGALYRANFEVQNSAGRHLTFWNRAFQTSSSVELVFRPKCVTNPSFCFWFRIISKVIKKKLRSILIIVPTRCNTKQSNYYSSSSLYMFRVSTTRIIRSTQNYNCGLRYWSYF